MDASERVFLKDGVKYMRFEEGEKLFSEGDRGTEMYVIITGKIKITLIRDGEDFELSTLAPGSFFGEMSLLEYEPRSANAYCVEPAILMVIDQDSFEKVMQKNPQLVYKIMKSLSGRLRDSNKKLYKYKKDFEDQVSASINKSRE